MSYARPMSKHFADFEFGKGAIDYGDDGPPDLPDDTPPPGGGSPDPVTASPFDFSAPVADDGELFATDGFDVGFGTDDFGGDFDLGDSDLGGNDHGIDGDFVD